MDQDPAWHSNGPDWGRFFGLYHAAAVRFARGLCGGRVEVAEDVVQEAARSLLERHADGKLELESGAHGRNYFFRAVHNLAVTAGRKAQSGPKTGLGTGSVDDFPGSPEVSDDAPGPFELVAGNDEASHLDEDLRRAIALLPEPERDILRLRYAEGRTFREIADSTHTAISTLHSRTESALAKIRKKLGKARRGA